MTAPLAIVLADDHALFREGVKSLLRRQGDLKVVAEADRVDDVEPALRRQPCDILLLDLHMDRSALAAIPSFATLATVMVLTMSESADDALAALRGGARAVVFKRFAVTTLLEAIRTVAAGHVWLPPALQAAFVAGLHDAEHPTLTRREREIVQHVARGRRNVEVARVLFISEETVKKHLNTIFQKLGVRDRVQMTLWAIRSGLVSGFEERPTGPAARGVRPADPPRKL
jgi:DNA-binding NarL/FixJ family response regulator